MKCPKCEGSGDKKEYDDFAERTLRFIGGCHHCNGTGEIQEGDYILYTGHEKLREKDKAVIAAAFEWLRSLDNWNPPCRIGRADFENAEAVLRMSVESHPDYKGE